MTRNFSPLLYVLSSFSLLPIFVIRFHHFSSHHCHYIFRFAIILHQFSTVFIVCNILLTCSCFNIFHCFSYFLIYFIVVHHFSSFHGFPPFPDFSRISLFFIVSYRSPFFPSSSMFFIGFNSFLICYCLFLIPRSSCVDPRFWILSTMPHIFMVFDDDMFFDSKFVV